MRFWLTTAAVLLSAKALVAAPDITAIVGTHVQPGYETLAVETAALAKAAAVDCSPQNSKLIGAYHDAFDAWVGVNHLRFGPSEQDDRAFALAFWPDPRGSPPKSLATLVREQDVAVFSPEEFADVSVAARGFYALEFLLFDPHFGEAEDTKYVCALTRAIAGDIAINSAAILGDWKASYGELMVKPGNDTFRTEDEVVRQFFTALSTGLEFTSEARLGRPMGTFDRPRPNRAEVWRSQRSLRHVILSLATTRELASLISGGDPKIDRAFATAIERAEGLDDTVFEGVSEPQGRLRIETLKQTVDVIRRQLAEEVGPALGIAAGFNSLDGD